MDTENSRNNINMLTDKDRVPRRCRSVDDVRRLVDNDAEPTTRRFEFESLFDLQEVDLKEIFGYLMMELDRIMLHEGVDLCQGFSDIVAVIDEKDIVTGNVCFIPEPYICSESTTLTRGKQMITIQRGCERCVSPFLLIH